jgi:hypothetical protein
LSDDHAVTVVIPASVAEALLDALMLGEYARSAPIVITDAPSNVTSISARRKTGRSLRPDARPSGDGGDAA